MKSQPIHIIDRITHQLVEEQVYGKSAIELLYGDNWFSETFGRTLLHLVVKWPLFSRFFGWLQKQSFTKRQIPPFIEKFQVDPSEFLDPVESFKSFNDFFIRKLKPTARPIYPERENAMIPADGRYWFYQDITQTDGFIVKGKKFSLSSLLDSSDLAQSYEGGSLILVRLCPTDYHRFHFPVDCIATKARYIPGYLYSVNPIALRKNLDIYISNKRAITELHSDIFGSVAFVELGATSVGSIHQTYIPDIHQKKGDEKGYFSFGGSALVILFQKGKIQLDQDLVDATKKGYEIRCLMGQSMGIALHE